jgi:hypothetical protein
MFLPETAYNTKYLCDMMISLVPVAVVYVHKKLVRKHFVSVDLSLSRDRSFVGKLGVGTGTGRLGVGSGTRDGGKAGLGVWNVYRPTAKR